MKAHVPVRLFVYKRTCFMTWSHSKIAWYATIFLFAALYVLPLVHRGAYLDGLHYAVISKNLAGGIGDFWHLYWLNYVPFHEHPPLFFFLESLFFTLFGTAFWVENLFMLPVAGGTLWLLWRMACLLSLWQGRPFLKTNAWLLLLLWQISSGVAFAYNNNTLDPLMALWDLAAIYWLFKAYLVHRQSAVLYFVAASGCIFLAYLTKGPVGLFPLGVPFLFALFYEKKRLLTYTAYASGLLFLVLFYFLALIVNSPDAWHFLKTYHIEQVFHSVAETTGSVWRLPFLLAHILELISIPAAVSATILVGAYFRKKSAVTLRPFLQKERKIAVLCLTIALSATLPIAVTKKIYSIYLIPSAPWFALAIFCFLSAYLPEGLRTFSQKTLKKARLLLVIAYALLGGTILWRWGMSGRPKEAPYLQLCDSLAQYHIPAVTPVFYEQQKAKDLNLNRYFDMTTNYYNRLYAIDSEYVTLATYLMRYRQMCLKFLSEQEAETPVYLLLHKDRVSYFEEALSVYALVFETDRYVLFTYKGSEE